MTKKLHLKRKNAIKECQVLWLEEIIASGLSKTGYLESPAGGKWRGRYQEDCPLCEYDSQFQGDCEHCPLKTQYGKICFKFGYARDILPSKEWMTAIRGLK